MDTVQISRLGRYRPLLVDEHDRLWASRGYTLYKSSDHGERFDVVGRLDAGFAHQLAGRLTLSSRLLRAGFHGLRILDNGTLLGVVKGGIVRLAPGETQFTVVHRFRHGSRPLTLCTTPGGAAFYGEYWGNDQREAVRIVGSFDAGDTWQAVYEFPAGSIRHVHGVHYDPYRDCCWVLTGDSDAESAVFVGGADWANLDRVVGGNQLCRAVTLIPTKDGVVLPTDTEHQQNYIQWLDPRTGTLEKIRPVAGTVFYSTKTVSKMLLSTVVEPGAGIQGDRVNILASSNGWDWEQIHTQRKDRLSPILFQYGTFLLAPSSSKSDLAFAGGQAVRRDDQRLLRIEFDDNATHHSES
ncbi:MAG: hypothetical protein AAGC71_02990 [Pseudomonadota bacterium]